MAHLSNRHHTVVLGLSGISTVYQESIRLCCHRKYSISSLSNPLFMQQEPDPVFIDLIVCVA